MYIQYTKFFFFGPTVWNSFYHHPSEKHSVSQIHLRQGQKCELITVCIVQEVFVYVCAIVCKVEITYLYTLIRFLRFMGT